MDLLSSREENQDGIVGNTAVSVETWKETKLLINKKFSVYDMLVVFKTFDDEKEKRDWTIISRRG